MAEGIRGAESAIVEPGAVVGEGTAIWHNSRVHRGAVVGRECVIGSDVHIEGVVGDRCKIQNGVTIYKGVTLDDDVFVGPFAVFTNDRNPRAFDPHWEIGETHVERGASIGANATIRCGVVLGALSLVGSGSVVTSNVKPLQCVVGNPARHLGWVDLSGRIVSRGVAFPNELIPILKDIDTHIMNLRHQREADADTN